MPEPMTILLVVAAIAILWILFKILLNMASALFRFGCFILFVIAVAAAIWTLLLSP